MTWKIVIHRFSFDIYLVIYLVRNCYFIQTGKNYVNCHSSKKWECHVKGRCYPNKMEIKIASTVIKIQTMFVVKQFFKMRFSTVLVSFLNPMWGELYISFRGETCMSTFTTGLVLFLIESKNVNHRRQTLSIDTDIGLITVKSDFYP